MMIRLLFSIIFVLGVTSLDQDAFGILGCDDPHCYALSQSSRSSPVDGLQYTLDSPDLYVDRNQCANIAVSTGWLITTTGEWIESGVTKGHVENVGCVTKLSTYYAFNNIINNDPHYQEYLVPNGRVDPGDDIDIEIKRSALQPKSSIQIFVTTPDYTSQFPTAQINMNSENTYYANYGIEGTISADDEYSSIPMSKFTNMKIRQNNVWLNLPSSATVSTLNTIDSRYVTSTAEGYIGKKCGNTGFIAGSVLSLDCNNIATRNQIPTPENKAINVTATRPYTISLDAVDTDKDYLTYNLVEHPTNGKIDHNNKGEKIPNTDEDSSRLIYTPASNPPESDSIRYSVTDGRFGHTREGLISIIGPTPANRAPTAVDDFAYSLSGNTIHFTWSHPHNGGSDITYYQVERSRDSVSWVPHNRYSETTTSFDYIRQPGYDQYFRIITHNQIGASAASNVLNVHIPDTTPPDITIQKPSDESTTTTSNVTVSGFIYEAMGSGIDNIKIRVDGVTSTIPITTTVLSADTSVKFESTLTGFSNGEHIIAVSAENGDNLKGTDSITITVDAPVAKTVTFFSDDFQGTMSSWNLTTQDDEYWSIRSPGIQIPNSTSTNKVAGTEDCDDVCTMILVDNVDLTQMRLPELGFYRFVGTGADIRDQEGIIAYVSVNGGDTWSILERFTADISKDDGIWHKEKYDLSDYSSTEFKVKFEGISSTNSEDTELDDVVIYDASPDTSPDTSPDASPDASPDPSPDTISPVITAPPDKTIEATGMLTLLGTSNLGQATATDNIDSNPTITSDAPESFPLGQTIVTYTATDDARNTATDVRG